MARVELLYFPGCRNVPQAREQLRRALEETGMPQKWSEVDVSSPDAPTELRGHGSPTILINGKDVAKESMPGGAACRLYLGSEVPGVPPFETIKAALRAAQQTSD